MSGLCLGQGRGASKELQRGGREEGGGEEAVREGRPCPERSCACFAFPLRRGHIYRGYRGRRPRAGRSRSGEAGAGRGLPQPVPHTQFLFIHGRRARGFPGDGAGLSRALDFPTKPENSPEAGPLPAHPGKGRAGGVRCASLRRHRDRHRHQEGNGHRDGSGHRHRHRAAVALRRAAGAARSLG